MPGREADEVGEALDRDGVAVADEVGDRVAHRRRPVDAHARRCSGCRNVSTCSRPALGTASPSSSALALAMSASYLSRTWSVSGASASDAPVDPEQDQRPRPVDRLRDRRRLLEVELADAPDDRRRPASRGRRRDPSHPRQQDLPLALRARVADVQVEAAPLERLGQVARVVRGQEDHRPARGDDRAELRDRDLEVGQDLEHQRLGLDLDPVDLVDEQDDRLVGADRRQQRPGQQERLARRCRPRARTTPRDPRRPGCAGAASCSSTRTGPSTRRGPRSTGAG